jgi:hypothetical protein
VQAVLAALPPGWRQAAAAATPSTSGPLEAYFATDFAAADGTVVPLVHAPPSEAMLAVGASLVSCVSIVPIGRRQAVPRACACAW